MTPSTNLLDRFDVCILSKKEFDKLESAPVQRNHQKRAKKKDVREKLRILKPQHCQIVTATLTEDSYDPVNGKWYAKGTKFLIDGHTRREFWNNGYSDYVPESLSETNYPLSSIAEVRELYYSYDSSTSVEKSTDLAYGACRRLGLNLNKHKLYQVSAFTWAAHFYDKVRFEKNSGYDGEGLANIYKEFSSEITFLDSIVWNKLGGNGKSGVEISGIVRTAAVLFLKKHQLNDASKGIIERIFSDDFDKKDEMGRMDGVTNLTRWLQDPTEDFSQSFATIPPLTEKSLYWMHQAYLEKTEGKERLNKKGDHSGTLEKYEKQNVKTTDVSIEEFAT